MAVYFIYGLNPRQHRMAIGKSSSIKKRKSDPPIDERDSYVVLVGWIEDDDVLELILKQRFSRRKVGGGWFDLQPTDVLPYLERADGKGFLAKREDAFEVVADDLSDTFVFAGFWE